MQAPSASSGQALAGYRVIDVGNVLAGPLVTQFLADMGAEVIKVETRTRLDGTRRGRPIVGEDIAGGDRGQWPELQPLFHCINRNKMGITVDLRKPEGITVIHDLARVSDVVLNNNAPGVMDRLGVGHETLAAVNPGIITVSMPGVGEEGPLRHVLAYASITSALSGLMGLIGYAPDSDGVGPEGLLAGQIQGAWGDVIASLSAAIGLMAAIHHRRDTGQGQRIELAQLEGAVSLLGEAFMDFNMNGRSRTNLGAGHAVMAPHGNYPCAGEDRWVSIAVKDQEEWLRFCEALGDPDWTRDPKFTDHYSRLEHVRDLDRMVSEWTAGRMTEEVTELLQSNGVAAMTVMNIEDQFSDPQSHERGVFVEMDHPMVGAEWIPGIPWKLSDTPGEVRHRAPFLGEHNEYVLGDLLGYSEEKRQELLEGGVLE